MGVKMDDDLLVGLMKYIYQQNIYQPSSNTWSYLGSPFIIQAESCAAEKKIKLDPYGCPIED